MPIPQGAKYVPGRRRVVLADGRTVTRAAAENMFAQSVGFRSNYELKTASAAYRRGLSDRGKSMFRRNMQEARKTGGTEAEKRAAALAVKLQRERKAGQDDNSPTGTKAQFLSVIGRRSATDIQVNVGDSA